MKKWARVINFIGFIWISFLIGFLFSTYLMVKYLLTGVIDGSEVPSGLISFIIAIDRSAIFNSLFRMFIFYGSPSFLAFIISAIFGRKKN